MRRIFRAAAQAAGRAAVATAKGVVNAIYSDTMRAKTAQGASEIATTLFQQAPGYSPVTAEKASDRIERAMGQNRAQASASTADNAAHRAQFQPIAQSQAHGQ